MLHQARIAAIAYRSFRRKNPHARKQTVLWPGSSTEPKRARTLWRVGILAVKFFLRLIRWCSKQPKLTKTEIRKAEAVYFEMCRDRVVTDEFSLMKMLQMAGFVCGYEKATRLLSEVKCRKGHSLKVSQFLKIVHRMKQEFVRENFSTHEWQDTYDALRESDTGKEDVAVSSVEKYLKQFDLQPVGLPGKSSQVIDPTVLSKSYKEEPTPMEKMRATPLIVKTAKSFQHSPKWGQRSRKQSVAVERQATKSAAPQRRNVPPGEWKMSDASMTMTFHKAPLLSDVTAQFESASIERVRLLTESRSSKLPTTAAGGGISAMSSIAPPRPQSAAARPGSATSWQKSASPALARRPMSAELMRIRRNLPKPTVDHFQPTPQFVVKPEERYRIFAKCKGLPSKESVAATPFFPETMDAASLAVNVLLSRDENPNGHRYDADSINRRRCVDV